MNEGTRYKENQQSTMPYLRSQTTPCATSHARQCSVERAAETPKVGISRVLVKASPAFGRRPLLKNTDYDDCLTFWKVKGRRTKMTHF